MKWIFGLILLSLSCYLEYQIQTLNSVIETQDTNNKIQKNIMIMCLDSINEQQEQIEKNKCQCKKVGVLP